MPLSLSILSATSLPEIPLSRGILEYFANFDLRMELTIQLNSIKTPKINQIPILPGKIIF
jgi:hypothetical protein